MVRTSRFLLFCALLLANGTHASENAKRPVPRDSTINAWIEDLRSNDVVVQENAHTQLQLAGAHARHKLQAALQSSTNLEQRRRLYELFYDGPSDPDESSMVGAHTAAECRRLVRLSQVLYVKDGQLQGLICAKNLGTQTIELLEIKLTIPNVDGGTQHSVFRLATTGPIHARPPEPGGRIRAIPVKLEAPGAALNEICRVEITALELAGD